MNPRTQIPASRWASACVLLLCGAHWVDAGAWSLTVNAGARRLYLHVGNGSAYANNNTINQVAVNVTGNQLIAGGALPMISDSSQSRSLWGDNNLTCPRPTSQVMVGASYRDTNNGFPSATLSVTSPANLTSGSNIIPFSEISWTVAAPGSGVPNVISAGAFGGTLTLATVPVNRFLENCHSFTYANSAVRAAGTYTGRVTYTLVSP